MDKSALSALAEQAAEMIGCTHCSFKEAKTTLVCGQYSYTFDRFSFSEYERIMDEESYHYFCSEARAAFERSHKKDARKDQRECAVLFALAQVFPRFYTMKINKTTRPDFILEDGTLQIGIEVTELVTNTEAFERILMNEARGYDSAEAAKTAALSTRGRKQASEYTYLNLGTAIGIFNKPEPHKDVIYAREIIKKYEKYKNEMAQYNEFIILCDAMSNGPAITEKEDCDHIVSLARKAIPETNIFDLYILRKNSYNALAVDQYRI